VALPESSLDRTRLVAITIGSVALLTEFPQLGNALRSPEYVRLASASILVSFLILVFTYLRGRSSWWTAVPLPVLITSPAPASRTPLPAERLCAALAAPVALSVATVTVGASIGVAVAEPGVTVTELIRRADVAMYAAKAAGKNRIEAFPPAQHVAA
jgi:hypothetical protein